MARYYVGIDLGTTNIAVAYVDVRERSPSGPKLHTFPIPQVVAPGEVAARPLLPSFLYLPAATEFPPGALDVPWQKGATEVVGVFARDHGAKVPGRQVSSAKSWLCHAGVDRTAPLLPWGAPADVPRLSPLEASARYLRHLVHAWNSQPQRSPDERLEEQRVVITVPASFDDVARNLTAEAARHAGLQQVTLLEEPQAAFYAWLGTHAPAEAAQLRPGMRCLVVDVGGGTTDFTLIRVEEEHGEAAFVREAVGDHLLLGGDNMDLALARWVEKQWEPHLPGGRLDSARFGALVQACRAAKEALLADPPPPQYPVTVMGRGRTVVGGSLSLALQPQQVRHFLFEGFFPHVPFQAEPQQGDDQLGLQEMGLPFVRDPGITRHLAAFLRRHLPAGTRPDAILFNGGVFQPESVRQRLLDVLQSWFATAAQPWQPLVLTSPSLDLAVAWGAAYFAWLKATGGRRIGGGIPRSYYIQIATEDLAPAAPASSPELPASSARPAANASPPPAERSASELPAESGPTASIAASASAPPQATPREVSPPASPAAAPSGSDSIPVLCVVPRRMEEGTEIRIPQPVLELTLGQPVLFPLYSSTVRGEDQPGQLLRLPSSALLPLPPLHTLLRGGKRTGVKRVPVTLAARCTEIGTLELFCESREGNRWRLEFNLREVLQPPGKDAETDDASGTARLVDVFPEEKIQAAQTLIAQVFASGSSSLASAEAAARPSPAPPPTPQELTRQLEAVLESPRSDWPTTVCRRLWDTLEAQAAGRSKSPAHLARWYNLSGFVLRPGFGDPLDRYRVESLWKLIMSAASAGPISHKAAVGEGGAEYWILWRRVAGGLNTALQQQLFSRLRPILLPQKGKAFSRPAANEYIEMWRAAAALERLDPRTKEQLAEQLLRDLKKTPLPPYLFWSLTRLGARVLLYGPLNTVVHPESASRWVETLLGFTPFDEQQRHQWLFCLTHLARRSGIRALDLDETLRRRVLETLRQQQAPAAWLRMVEEVATQAREDSSRLFGDSLPIGLRLTRQS
jgi:hypothetical protein